MMPRRFSLFPALCAVILFATGTTGIAHAQNAHANPNATDSPGHSEDHGNSGNGNGGGNGSGGSNNGGGNGGGNGNGGNGGGNSGGPASSSAHRGGASATSPQAVTSVPTVPLESVIDQVNDVTDGKVIDAKIVTVRGFLLYEIRVLEANDTVHRLYYYARSGRPVQ